MSSGKILIVDDDALARELCSDILSGAGHTVKTVSNGSEAMAALQDENFDIVVTDLVMPGMDGIEVLEGVKQFNALIDVVVVTGHSSIESAITALKKGAFEYIRKPVNADELVLTIKSCLEKKDLLEENQQMRQSLRLYRVGRTITSSLDIEKLYEITLDSLLQTLPAEAAIITIYNTDKTKLKVKSSRQLAHGTGQLAHKLFTERYESGMRDSDEIKVFAIDSLEADGWEGLVDFSTLMAIPLSQDGGQMYGYMLVLSKRSEGEYGQEDRKVASFISDHACQAIVNARKYGEAQEMAYIDSLTNLYNSKYLELSLDKELKRADRQKSSVTVLFLDIDHFKNVNDENDHIAGSKVLVEVGKIIQGTIREVDTAIRYGGDEYVVILVDADYEAGYLVAERIRSEVETNDFLKEDGLNLKVTVSIGVATYPVHTKEKNELLKIADSAMYSAKHTSRNMVFLTPLPDSVPAEKDSVEG